MHLKISSAKWRLFCLGLNVLSKVELFPYVDIDGLVIDLHKNDLEGGPDCGWHHPSRHIKAHLQYIRDLGPSIRVRARTQSKQVNWCFAFTLIRVRVRDFCLGRPCPSSSLHVAISSDADVLGWFRCLPRFLRLYRRSDRGPVLRTSEFVRGYETRMLKAACSRGRCQIWSKMAVDSDGLGSEPRMWCKHNSVRVSDTDSDTDARTV